MIGSRVSLQDPKRRKGHRSNEEVPKGGSSRRSHRMPTVILIILVYTVCFLFVSSNVRFAVEREPGTEIDSILQKHNSYVPPAVLGMISSSQKANDNNLSRKEANSTSHEKELLFLNVSNVSSIRMKEQSLSEYGDNRQSRSSYTIDVLIIGSKNNINQAKVQRETWASHEAVRHFFLSTEYDDIDPKCRNESSWSQQELSKAVAPCKQDFWSEEHSLNKLTKQYRNQFARVQWLEEKANPKGWLCVQRRFVTSLTTLVELYAETKSLPDYFILADDDTYINIDHIVKQMMIDPEELKAKGIDEKMMVFPTVNTPVVTAGCRVRAPDNQITLLFPFGGYGTFFSRGSLERLIEPLHCNEGGAGGTMNTPSRLSADQQSCEKLLYKTKNHYPMNATIAEEKFFEVGDSLNQVFYKYSREVKHFCLHSDWFVGYMANFHNISRHTTNVTDNWFDPKKMDVEENRMHELKDSEIYRSNKPGGFCRYGDKMPCIPGATVCHRMNPTSLRNIHNQSSLLK